MTNVILLVFCVVCLTRVSYSDEAERLTDLPGELPPLEDYEETLTDINTNLKNEGAQTKDILSKLIRNIDKTEDDLEAVKETTLDLIRNINPEGEEQLNAFTPKIKKFSVITYLNENWLNAMKHCKKRGMELASIENEYEQGQLEAVVNEMDSDIFPLWIAASDITTEGAFTWSSSGKPTTYSKWLRDQPDGQREENCVALRQTGEGYGWIDRDCNDYIHFACQYFGESPNHHHV